VIFYLSSSGFFSNHEGLHSWAALVSQAVFWHGSYDVIRTI